MAALGLALWASSVQAVELQLPQNAVLMREVVVAVGHVDLPTGPTVDGWLPTEAREGEVTEQAWRIAAAQLTTLQILAPLRDQLVAQGFDVVLDCATEACGGFDFRRAVRVLPPPEMFVNLGDFRWLSAVSETEAVAVMVSRSEAAGFVQVTRVGGSQGARPLGTAGDAPLEGRVPVVRGAVGDIGAALETEGHAVLADLAFQTGSAELAEGDFQSLQSLAAYLAAHPDYRVALVGHTDSEGSLDANIALSRRRATSVLDRLVEDLGVAPGQVQAEGMGWLAPIAPNLTEAGREANRRVEVILLTTE